MRVFEVIRGQPVTSAALAGYLTPVTGPRVATSCRFSGTPVGGLGGAIFMG